MLNMSDLLSHGAHDSIAASAVSSTSSTLIYQQELAKLLAKSRGTAYESTLRRFMEQRVASGVDEPPAPAFVVPAPVKSSAPSSAPLSKAALLSAMTRGAPRSKQQQQHVSVLSTPLERHRWSGPEREVNSSLCVPRTTTNHLGRQRPAASDERAPQTCVIVNTTHLPDPPRGGNDTLGSQRRVTERGFQAWLDARRRVPTEAEEAARMRAGMGMRPGDDGSLAGESLVDSLDLPRPPGPGAPQVYARLAGLTPPLNARARAAARLADAQRDLTFAPRIDAHSRELAEAVRRQQQQQHWHQQQQYREDHVLVSQHPHLPPRPRSASFDPDHWSRRSSSPAPSSPCYSVRGRSPMPVNRTPRGFGSSSPRRCSIPSSDQVIRLVEDRGYSPALARAALSGARHASPGERARAKRPSRAASPAPLLPPPPPASPSSSFYGRPRRGSSASSLSPQRRSSSPAVTRVRRESTGDVPVFTNYRSEVIMSDRGEERNFYER